MVTINNQTSSPTPDGGGSDPNAEASGSSGAAFVRATLDEIAETRESLSTGTFALPEDAAFFRELNGIEEAVGDGDVGGARTAVDRLTDDLEAASGDALDIDFETHRAFDRLERDGRLSPEDAEILKSQSVLINSLENEVDFVYATNLPAFTGDEKRAFTAALDGLQVGLEGQILQAADDLDPASAERVGFDAEQTSLYDDIRVLTDGFGQTAFTLPREFADPGLIEADRVEPEAPDAGLIGDGREYVDTLEAGGELSEGRADTIRSDDTVLQKIGSFLETRQRTLDGGAEGDGGNQRAVDVLISDVGSSAGPADRHLSRLFQRDSIGADQFRELANDIDYLREVLELFPDHDEPVPISAAADEVTRERLGGLPETA